jgi:hypothetical protein
LVEPPSAITTVMAFSKASLVMIWRAVIPCLISIHDGLAGATRDGVAAAVDGGRCGRTRQRQPHRLADAGHRVRRVHAAARTLAGADRALDLIDLLAGDQPGAQAPTASKASMIVTSRSSTLPGRIDPA